jgi:predicted nucleic acid-binding protein
MPEIIISDTSCLISLNKINCLFLLKELYGNILITPEVKNEFGENLPVWIKVAKAKDNNIYRDLEKKLDKGEASSIALALELKKLYFNY